MSRRPLRALAASSSLAVAIACGGPGASTDALREARTLDATVDELEVLAEELTLGLTDALTAPAESPEAALDRLDAYIEANAEEMDRVAATIAERIGDFDDTQRRAYVESMAEVMAGPTFAWRDAYFDFLDEHPELTDRMREVIAPIGPQIPPVERPF